MSSDNSQRKVLVTGASGFLGSEIVRLCLAEGIDIRCTGRRKVRPRFDGLCDYHQVDFQGSEIPTSLFADVNTVIHVAGLAHQFGAKGADLDAFQSVNRDAVQRIANAAAENGVKHFVLVSSSGVYGTARELCDEQDECCPVGPYAQSKLAGEQAAITEIDNTDMHLTVLRMTTLYGPGDRGNVARLMHAIDSQKFINIGDGSNLKSLLHVNDAARAVLLAAGRDANPLIAIYNVASDPEQMKSVLNELQVQLGKKTLLSIPSGFALFGANVLSTMSLGRGPFPRILTTIQKWTRSDTFDGTKFRQDFDFTPRMSLAAGIASQVQQYRRDTPSQQASSLAKPSFSKVLFDFSLASVLTILFAIPMFIIAALVKATSKGPIIYWSSRVGKDGSTFPMAKFRTMRTDTPEVATHLLSDSRSYITKLGAILRKTSLDELPQLFNILGGQMSFVGPRPSLPSQHEVNDLRDAFSVSQLKPGITGWAAINGRDELHCSEKVAFDYQYLQRQSFVFDLKIIAMTALAVFRSDGIKQADDDGGEPFIVLSDGSSRNVICTTDAVAAGCLAHTQGTWNDSRFVSLRTDGEVSKAEIVAAIGDAPIVTYVSRANEQKSSSPSAELIRSVLSNSQKLNCIELPALQTGMTLHDSLILDAKLILGENRASDAAKHVRHQTLQAPTVDCGTQ